MGQNQVGGERKRNSCAGLQAARDFRLGVGLLYYSFLAYLRFAALGGGGKLHCSTLHYIGTLTIDGWMDGWMD